MAAILGVDGRSTVPLMQSNIRDCLLAYNQEDNTAESACVESHGRVHVRLTLGYDPECVFQWVPFSKINWKRFFEDSDLVVSSYYIRSALTHKDKLQHMIYNAIHQKETKEEAKNSISGTYWLIDDNFRETLQRVYIPTVTLPQDFTTLDARSLEQELGHKGQNTTCYVIKHSRGSNGLDVSFAQGSKELESTLHIIPSLSRGERSGSWMLQQCVSDTVLANGRKMSLRVNLVAIGNLCVYVHDEVLCHIASPQYTGLNFWVTNHSQNSNGDSVTLENLFNSYSITNYSDGSWWDPKCQNCEGIRQECRRIVCSIFAATLSRSEAPNSGAFMPMKNCFEVFGLDLLPKKNGDFSVLELNDGPALASRAMPELNRRMVKEVLDLTFSPLVLWKITQRRFVEEYQGKVRNSASPSHCTNLTIGFRLVLCRQRNYFSDYIDLPA
eukprot:gb/GECG01004339.1/.p1 GENE.gb/GECG01004339.1/~~gb/GECG01004339.1/.p1  ORF type:complete len:441 (+),score=27.10 gb/GECG01004339.1/:1-1323(+)